MASNVTRDHHNLRRNLKLNGNYISNDGGDEGISIADDGDVTVGSLITNNISPAGQLTIDAAGDIILDTGADDVDFKTNGDLFAKFNSESVGSTTSLTLYEEGGGGSGSADYLKINVAANGVTTIATEDSDGMLGHLTLDADGAIILDAANGVINFDKNGTVFGSLLTTSAGVLELNSSGNYDLKLESNGNGDIILDSGTGITKFYVAGDTDDLCTLTVAADGVTTIATADSDAALAHLTLDIDGHIELDSETGVFRFFHSGSSTNSAKIIVNNTSGKTQFFTISAQTPGDGHLEFEVDGHVEFDDCAVGFDRLEATFSTTAIIESGGSDDTDIDFRRSNKYRLEMTADIAQMNLIFPNTSGNFLIVCTTNGDHDVTAWKVWEHDSVAGSTNAAATTDVMWAGGSVPAFTSSGVDIVSFYWDANEQQAYGTASLAFATP